MTDNPETRNQIPPPGAHSRAGAQNQERDLTAFDYGIQREADQGDDDLIGLLTRVIVNLPERMAALEDKLDQLIREKTKKDWYTTAEVSELLGKAEFTVREWCRHGRISAEKKFSGRGKFRAWAISHKELERFHREGLRPTAV